MTTVSVAARADEDALLEALAMKHGEDGFGQFDHAKVREIIRRGIRWEMAVIGVIRGRKGVEGSVGLYCESPWWTQDAVLMDRWLFVSPDHRKSAHAKDLIGFAKWASTYMGKPLMMSVAITEATIQKSKLYERQFKRQSGAIFLFHPEVAPAA